MSGSYVCGMLIKRDGFASSITHLLDSTLDRSKYPDRFIAQWNPRPTWRTRQELIELVENIELSGIAPKYSYEVEGYQKYARDDAPLPEELVSIDGLGRKYVESLDGVVKEKPVKLLVFEYNQGLWGDPLEDIVLEVHLSHSAYSIIPAQLDTTFMLQKVVEVMQPRYMWSSYVDTDLVPISDRSIPKPWAPKQPYGQTIVFGSELINDLALPLEKFLNDSDIYNVKILNGPILWLSPPCGIGNELPFLTQALFEFEKGSASAVFTDKALEKFLYSNQDVLKKLTDNVTTKHHRAVERILSTLTV